jgi:N-acetylmuramoyl-L-alanine amidase
MLAPLPQAQGTAPATPLVLITRDARRPVPTTMLSGQELIGLDDVASLFQVTVAEDALAGGFTIAYRGRTVVASLDQPMASVNNRVVMLPSPVVRIGRRALVPVEFLSRALAQIYDQRIELRRPSRLLLLGDVRVPRVSVRIESAGPPTRATIEVVPATAVTPAVENTRVVVRVDADALDLALPSAIGGGLIEQVRAGDQPNTVTLTLTPAAGMARATVALSENAARVTVEVPSANAPAADPPASAAPPTTPSTAPPPPPVPRVAFQTIVLDPGHGGPDTGVRGAGGAEEKQLTLDIARRLRAAIETRLGLRVVLTREDDRALGLDERAAVANNSKGDLFLSLHANGAPVSSMAGAEVIYLKMTDTDAGDGEGEGPAIPVLGGGTRRIDVVRWDFAQVRHLESSTILAGMLDEELRRRDVAMSPRGIQRAPMRALTATNMPAALIEVAYLTNPKQETLTTQEGFRNSVAEALFDAVVRFRGYVEAQRER